MVPIVTALIIDFPFFDVYRLVWTVSRPRILMYTCNLLFRLRVSTRIVDLD